VQLARPCAATNCSSVLFLDRCYARGHLRLSSADFSFWSRQITNILAITATGVPLLLAIASSQKLTPSGSEAVDIAVGSLPPWP